MWLLPRREQRERSCRWKTEMSCCRLKRWTLLDRDAAEEHSSWAAKKAWAAVSRWGGRRCHGRQSRCLLRVQEQADVPSLLLRQLKDQQDSHKQSLVRYTRACCLQRACLKGDLSPFDSPPCRRHHAAVGTTADTQNNRYCCRRCIRWTILTRDNTCCRRRR